MERSFPNEGSVQQLPISLSEIIARLELRLSFQLLTVWAENVTAPSAVVVSWIMMPDWAIGVMNSWLTLIATFTVMEPCGYVVALSTETGSGIDTRVTSMAATQAILQHRVISQKRNLDFHGIVILSKAPRGRCTLGKPGSHAV